MKKSPLSKSSGFTIIEVLVSAVVFMIGFSILVTLLNTTLNKFSIQELEQASCIGEDFMNHTIVMKDTINLDTIINRSGIKFKVTKQIQIDNDLARISIHVFRETSGELVIDLYNEFIASDKPTRDDAD